MNEKLKAYGIFLGGLGVLIFAIAFAAKNCPSERPEIFQEGATAQSISDFIHETKSEFTSAVNAPSIQEAFDEAARNALEDTELKITSETKTIQR